MKLRGLLLLTLLSLQSLALDRGDIKIMRDSGVKIAFPHEDKAHDISRTMRPADLMRVNYIKLNGQSLRKIPAWLPKMTNLVKLELEDTNMDLIDLFALKSLSNLNTLNLNNNKNLFDKGGSLSELLSHFSLSELYLANTGGSSSDYANIGNSKSLIKLDLSDNTISSINALHLERLKHLKSLKMVGNSIDGTLDTAYLPKRSLVYLNLSSNNISRLKYSDDFPALESLDIAKNRSYLEFDEDWDDAYILKRLNKGSFNKDVALPKSIMKRLGIKFKWITPTNSICRTNGGKVDSNGCFTPYWKIANQICSEMNSNLPTIEELIKVVETCGGNTCNKLYWKSEEEIEKPNINNASYQRCYKSHGFTANDYWSLSKDKDEDECGSFFSVKDCRKYLNFYKGYIWTFIKGDDYYVRCISIK